MEVPWPPEQRYCEAGCGTVVPPRLSSSIPGRCTSGAGFVYLVATEGMDVIGCHLRHHSLYLSPLSARILAQRPMCQKEELECCMGRYGGEMHSLSRLAVRYEAIHGLFWLSVHAVFLSPSGQMSRYHRFLPDSAQFIIISHPVIRRYWRRLKITHKKFSLVIPAYLVNIFRLQGTQRLK